MAPKNALPAAVLAFAILSAAPALAHDEWYTGHRAFHDQLGDAHERAHQEGFDSRAEHRAYHRALRNLHEGSHEDRDGYSSHYDRPRYYYSYPSYRSYGW